MKFKMNNGIKWVIEQDSNERVLLTVLNSKGETDRQESMTGAAFTTMWQDFVNYSQTGVHIITEFERKCLKGEVEQKNN